MSAANPDTATHLRLVTIDDDIVAPTLFDAHPELDTASPTTAATHSALDSAAARAHPSSGGRGLAAPSSGTSSGRRARDLAHFPPEVRRLRRAILSDGLARGRAINPDAVSVILAAKLVHQSPLLHFTEDIVWDLLWFDICNWCGLRRLEVPSGIVAAMWTTLQYLFETELLDPHSDVIDDLCAPLQTSGGLDPMGRTRFPV